MQNIIAGDINIDLTKCAVDTKTAEYVDMLLSNNFVPLLVMPTRITTRSASLIDHIYFFEGQCKTDCITVRSGNFLEDITDHLPGYAVITNKKNHKNKPRPMIRIFSDKNVNEFVHLLQIADWASVYNEADVNDSYNMFSEIIQTAFNQAFCLTRLSRKRARDKKMDYKCS
jgi:hypothetical protein